MTCRLVLKLDEEIDQLFKACSSAINFLQVVYENDSLISANTLYARNEIPLRRQNDVYAMLCFID